MSKHLKNILDGMRQALVISPSTGYERPTREGFHKDNRALKNDSKNVIRDLRRVTENHGK